MSYNLLADCCANPVSFSTSQQVIDFNFRAPRIIEEIRQSGATLICLQEIDRIDDYYHEKLTEMGFNVHYGKKVPSKPTPEEPRPHTIAIAYKTSEWRCIDCEIVHLSDLASWVPEHEEFSHYKRAMFALLQHTGSNTKIVVGNTHFEH